MQLDEERSSKEVRYYAVESLAKTSRTIVDLADGMVRARARIERTRESRPDQSYDAYRELLYGRDKLIEALSAAHLAFAELEDEALAGIANVLIKVLADIDVMIPDYAPITAVLKAVATEMVPEKAVTAAVIGNLMNEAKMGFYPTDLENVKYIANGIRFPEERKVNLLDPCCGEGAALHALANGRSCATYGCELATSRAEKAQDRLDRVGFGSFFGSQLSREAFHLLFLNPPYMSVVGESGRSREEKRFLVSSIPHLMMGGLMVYIVPFYRLTPDICGILANHFEDLSIYRFTDDEFSKYRQVAVFGVRRWYENNPKVAQALEQCTHSPETLACITQLPEGRYSLPDLEKDVQIFKGAVFNQLELARQLQASTSFDRLLTRTTHADRKLRPLLPLSVGQIGLIGGSGLINGLVKCDVPHIVKGCIVKHKTTAREAFFNEEGRVTGEETKETFSNKMVFRILTRYGFKALA